MFQFLKSEENRGVNDCVSGSAFLTLSQAFIPASRKRPHTIPVSSMGRKCPIFGFMIWGTHIGGRLYLVFSVTFSKSDDAGQ